MKAEYRLLSPDGQAREDGEAEVEVRDRRLVLAAEGASVLPIPFGQIAAVTGPEPFTVRLTLAGGDVIELGRLGVMRPGRHPPRAGRDPDPDRRPA